jgi:hypothetical protein
VSFGLIRTPADLAMRRGNPLAFINVRERGPSESALPVCTRAGPMMEREAGFEYPRGWPPARGCRVPRASMTVPVGILVKGHFAVPGAEDEAWHLGCSPSGCLRDCAREGRSDRVVPLDALEKESPGGPGETKGGLGQWQPDPDIIPPLCMAWQA